MRRSYDDGRKIIERHSFSTLWNGIAGSYIDIYIARAFCLPPPPPPTPTPPPVVCWMRSAAFKTNWAHTERVYVSVCNIFKEIYILTYFFI